ncbi:glycosyltransferase family 2 protein [Xanthomarina sp. F1114]|uniref:glycosyltransferase family 2 protein n=1 Tax=Xanthomarina sp. F1114 TaxID=2996019 RepID=UPI00225E64CB|nr:glycosyltransferase family 2 protein [Xanthomarina sp. F1114]MCX7549055.1 glycosyltransferase family 2 protein [Xanthomarina sp. F1114]
MINTFIIIVTYNGMKWIPKCLESCKDYPVIIVDNASSDDTISFIETYYPNVTLFKQSENLGFGQANNIGIRYALDQGAEHVFLLNQDAYLVDNVLDKLIIVQKQYPAYGILSPIHLDGSGSKLDRKFCNYVAYRKNPDFYSDFVLGKSLKKVYEVPFVNAAGWLLSRKLLETVGGFDPLFYHYGEDDNYCQRTIYHNFKIGVVPTAFLLHDRADRVEPKYKKGSTDYFKHIELNLKAQYANVNLPLMERFQELKRRRIRSKWRAYIEFKFQEALYLKKEVKLIQELESKIKSSRKRNQTQRSHYL